MNEEPNEDSYPFEIQSDRANFILNFADDDDNDSDHSAETEHCEKRRKVDEDGFVTPATPDIPKTSIQYMAEKFTDTSNDAQYSMAAHDMGSPEQEEEEEEEDRKDFYQDMNGEDEEEEQRGSAQQQTEEKSPAPVDIGGGGDARPDVINLLDDESKDEPIANLLRRLVQETTELQQSWINPMSESEQFELSCGKKLDEILEKARDHEENLKQQKEKLAERLKTLSRALQLL